MFFTIRFPKKNGCYLVDGYLVWKFKRTDNGFSQGDFSFFLTKEGVVVDVVDVSLEGEELDSLKFQRTFTTEKEFDAMLVGGWQFRPIDPNPFYRPQ